ncbi:GtrA family protein [Pantoea sp. 1.19]|uniref:GtrA family protein n=1 Tax=Pantoea sp. 1.19 TaxID=1925589 RepID=UPI000948AC12|nr:GtrA family protein [Pantoea sp. 1.19]
MFKLFARYLSIGVLNTAIHWVAFYVILHTAGVSQALANFGAFCIAVTFSFFANAKWTFNSETTTLRYMLYVVFMGSTAALVGWVADKCAMPTLITLAGFSAISLVCGFIYSKYIVFRESK